MTLDGWILMQRKVNGSSVSFNQNWVTYRDGFGSATGNDNYWLGLDKVYRLMQLGSVRLRVEVGIWKYKTASVIHYEPYVHLYIMNIIFCFCHDKTVQEINSRCATVNICRIRNPKSDNRLLFYGYKYISNMVAVHHLELKKNQF